MMHLACVGGPLEFDQERPRVWIVEELADSVVRRRALCLTERMARDQAIDWLHPSKRAAGVSRCRIWNLAECRGQEVALR